METTENENQPQDVRPAAHGTDELPPNGLDQKNTSEFGRPRHPKASDKVERGIQGIPSLCDGISGQPLRQADDPVAGQAKIDRILTEHYAESAKKELIKSRIKEKGQYTLLGQFSVRLDQSRDHYWADVPALGDNTVRVAPKILEQFGDVLLTSGAWGTMEIEYDGSYEIKGKKFPFYVRGFTPLQYTRLDIDDFVAKRPLFSDSEWVDLLIQSIGFNPMKFNHRVKMLMLLRLVAIR